MRSARSAPSNANTPPAGNDDPSSAGAHAQFAEGKQFVEAHDEADEKRSGAHAEDRRAKVWIVPAELQAFGDSRSMCLRSVSGSGGGSGLRMSASENAETRQEQASKAMAMVP